MTTSSDVPNQHRLTQVADNQPTTPPSIDVAVLVLFFNRPEPLRQTLEAVRQARPSRLFLYQDGPRDERDIEAINECRKVAESLIDWQCDVRRNYQSDNSGCDPSNYNAQKWAFSMADKCIVLEDDDVCTVSFFRFCKELLDRYENDRRVWMITGFNHEEHTPTQDNADYLFARTCTIWGWASWKRVFDTWDAAYSWVDDPQKFELFKKLIKQRRLHRDYIRMTLQHKASGKPFYESIFFASMLFNDGLCAVPRSNLLNNLGPISGDSTHYGDSLNTLPKGFRRIFTMNRHELEFPLTHPDKVEEDVEFRKRVYRILAWDNPAIKVCRSLEELALNIKHGHFKNIARAISNRIRKTLRLDKRH